MSHEFTMESQTMLTLAGRSAVILMATYNDWLSVEHLLPRIDDELSALGMKCRIVIVDDGSTEPVAFNLKGDGFKAIERVEALLLNGNQGNQRATAIGVAHVAQNEQADYLVVMDSDHEDRPEDIPRLLKACAESGDDKIVFAARTKRSEGWLFQVFYRLYQKIFLASTGNNIFMGNFSVIPWSRVRRLAFVAELWNHFPAAILRARLPFISISSERGRRMFGKSQMNVTRLLVHAFSGLAVHADTLSSRLLVASIFLVGFILSILAVVTGLRLFTDIPITGWTSLVIIGLIMILIQVVSTSSIVLLLISSQRLQPRLIPARDFQQFLLDRMVLYPVQNDRA